MNNLKQYSEPDTKINLLNIITNKTIRKSKDVSRVRCVKEFLEIFYRKKTNK